jgi:hypothetical protein
MVGWESTRYGRSEFPVSILADVWCGVIADQMVGPFFLEERGQVQSSRGFWYMSCRACWKCASDNVEAAILVAFPRARTYLSTRTLISAFILAALPPPPPRKGGGGVPQHWPPRSPYFSLLDFHVGGYTKDLVYEREVDTREDLIRGIVDVVTRISDRDTFRRVTCPDVKRARMCTEAEGEHFEHLF